MIKLHDVSSIDLINWDTKIGGTYVRDYFSLMIKNTPSSFVSNIQTEIRLLELESVVLPMTINNEEYENSYVCSPFTHYVSYAKEELWELKNPLAEKILLPFINLMGVWFKKCKINKVVIVNNWLLSTNLYYPLSTEEIKEITILLKKTFPEHLIMFRSLNNYLHKELIQAAQDVGYKTTFSRSVYLYKPNVMNQLTRKEKKDIKNDLRLLKNSGYTIVNNKSISDEEISTIFDLYNQLYIDKYSNKNPMFSHLYYKNGIEHDLFQFRALKQNNKIEAVLGYFVRNGVATAPIFGYNMTLDKKEGLYRLLSIIFLEECLEKNLILHASAGAGQFKRNRGAQQELEYSLIYYKHLPRKRRFIWNTLIFLLTRFLEPMAKKRKF